MRLLPLVFLVACSGETLPADYEVPADCIKMNAQPIPEEEGNDPHEGIKNVYGCNATAEQLGAGPVDGYPNGTQIIKTSRRDHQDHDWLVAFAEKSDGEWAWEEYTRNFDDEEYVKLSVKESVCTDCHRDAKAVDWIYTTYTP